MRLEGYNKDLTGNRYGRLLVIGPSTRRGNKTHRYWTCRCSCGNVTKIRHNHLTGQTIRSCGCSHFYTNSKHPHWKGCGQIPGAYFSVVRQSARKRDLLFDVTIQQIWEVFQKQNGKCALSGLPLEFNTVLRSTSGTASLDRINSSKGYVVGNVQWVHKLVNTMKQDLTDKDFVKFCRKISNYRKDLL